MSPDRKVTLLTLGLMTVAATIAVALVDRAAPLESGLRWWHLIAFFAFAEIAVAHIEVRNEAVTLSLSEAGLVIAVVFLPPVGVVAARVIGGIVALAWRRLGLQKLLFNIALFAAEAGCALFLVHVVFDVRPDGVVLWATSGASVLVAAMLSVLAVSVVISFFDSNQPIGLMRSALAVQAVVAMSSISVATVGAAAVLHSPVNIVYLAILLSGTGVLLRRDARTAQRASDLESVGRFTSSLVGLTSSEEVIETSLRSIARTLRANRAAIVMKSSSRGVQSCTYLVESGELRKSVGYDFSPLFDVVDEPAIMGAGTTLANSSLPTGVVAPITVDRQQGLIAVWDRSTNVGSFVSGDHRMLGTMAAQVHVALERTALIDQLHYDAHHDALTRLPNRLGFSERVTSTDEFVGALFVLDLDRFKDINDTLGHPTGDKALQTIARRLQGVLVGSSILARLGGDEFAIFDRTITTTAGASELAEQLIACIESPMQLEDLSLQLGASIGIALAPAHGDDLTSLMSHADTAMYEAKDHQSGWQFYRHEADTNDPRRLELLGDLRKAIEDGELDVWYQPRVALEDRAVVGAEALARWTHPRYGFIPPDEFIGLAEGAGLMRDLTNVILERAVSDIRRWKEEGHELQVSVNLSTRNLLDDSLPRRVAALLRRNNLSGEHISFEITETAIMIDRARVAELLREFSDLGITLAIDDYGTGYSSLAYLRELPVDELKIDRSFITNVDFDPHNEVIVRSTIELAHNLGLVVVAEGIEREEEFEMLSSLGCDFAQGYLISKPLPIATFELWLADNGHFPRAEPELATVSPLPRLADAVHR